MVIPGTICPPRFHRECTEKNIANRISEIRWCVLFVTFKVLSGLVHKLSCVLEWYLTSFRFEEQAIQATDKRGFKI